MKAWEDKKKNAGGEGTDVEGELGDVVRKANVRNSRGPTSWQIRKIRKNSMHRGKLGARRTGDRRERYKYKYKYKYNDEIISLNGGD